MRRSLHATRLIYILDALVFDFIITDEDGERLCTMQNFGVAMHRHSILPDVKNRLDLIYQPFAIQDRTTTHFSTSRYHDTTNKIYGSLIKDLVKATGIPDKYYTLGSKETKVRKHQCRRTSLPTDTVDTRLFQLGNGDASHGPEPHNDPEVLDFFKTLITLN